MHLLSAEVKIISSLSPFARLYSPKSQVPSLQLFGVLINHLEAIIMVVL